MTPPLVLPPEDRALSPHTGWTRAHWAALADHMLLSVRPYFSDDRARLLLPGRTSAYGTASDSLEGFARTFLLAGFRIAGEDGDDPHGFLAWYREGLLAGTDPANPDRWPRPDELGQAKVEAASIALILQLTRPWLWDTLGAPEQEQVIAWLATVIGGEYPPINWVWFQIVVESFLAEVGGPFSPDDVRDDLLIHEGLYREHGWYSDGPERAYDYYVGWALHFYPAIWSAWPSAPRFGSEELRPLWLDRMRAYLDDYVHLLGADGSPVLQGRSLIYRFAAAAPLWAGAATGATNLSPGLIRRAASGILRSFWEHGVPDERGLLTVGLHGEWPAMAQSYSGSGSPYWAAKGFHGLVLPADHPVWTAREEPLPVERSDFRRVITAPGWVVSGTRDDGIVRVINHGTDHAHPGALVTDSPLYARLGYSSATIPPLTGPTLASPVDNSVGVEEQDGIGHRAGFETLFVTGDERTASGASRWRPHWLVEDSGGPDHGSGRGGLFREDEPLAVTSIVRGAWEVRAVVTSAADGPRRIVVSGWPLSAEGAAAAIEGDGMWVRGPRATSALVTLTPERAADLSAVSESDVTPLAATTTTPRIAWTAPAEATTLLCAVYLGGSAVAGAPQASVDGTEATVTWPDGETTRHPLGQPVADGSPRASGAAPSLVGESRIAR